MCTDPCDFVTCGVNAQCVSGNSTNGTFDCVCNPGFTGNPFSICFSKQIILQLVMNIHIHIFNVLLRGQEINTQKIPMVGFFVFIEGTCATFYLCRMVFPFKIDCIYT